MYNYNKYRPSSEETHGEKLYAGQMGLSELSPLRTDGSRDSQAGEAGPRDQWLRTLKN